MRGSSSSRFAAWYAKVAITTAACIKSSRCSRSYTSMSVWCVAKKPPSYSIGSWMNWKPGRPTASNDWWSVPPVLRIVTRLAPRSSTAAIQLSNTGFTAEFSWR